MSRKKKKKNYVGGYQVHPFIKNFGYEIMDTKSFEEGVDIVLNTPKKKTFSRRHVLVNLAKKNPHCVCCKRKGVKFCLGKGKMSNTPERGADLHWDLYTHDDIALSVDHIHPRSKGGRDHMSNCQLMCIECNNLKGNKPQRLIPYKYLLDVGYKVVAYQKAGMAFMIVGDYEVIPEGVLNPIKDFVIPNDTEFEGKMVYYFNDANTDYQNNFIEKFKNMCGEQYHDCITELSNMINDAGVYAFLEPLNYQIGGVAITSNIIAVNSNRNNIANSIFVTLHELGHTRQYKKYGEDAAINMYLRLIQGEDINVITKELYNYETTANRFASLMFRQLKKKFDIPNFDKQMTYVDTYSLNYTLQNMKYILISRKAETANDVRGIMNNFIR